MYDHDTWYPASVRVQLTLLGASGFVYAKKFIYDNKKYGQYESFTMLNNRDVPDTVLPDTG
jgi:hypothetical protein